MSCQLCEVEYLKDKTAILETAIRRITNVITFSENSKQTADEKKAIIDSFADFKQRWDSHKCGHNTIVVAEEEIFRAPEGTAFKPIRRKRGRPRKRRPGTPADTLSGDDAGGKAL